MRPGRREWQTDFITRAGGRVGFLNLRTDAQESSGNPIIRYRSRPPAGAALPQGFAEQLAAAGGFAGPDVAQRIAWLGRPREGGETFQTIDAGALITWSDAAVSSRAGFARARPVLSGTLPQLVSTESGPGRAHLVWRGIEGDSARYSIQRRAGGEDWRTLSTARVGRDGLLTCEDRGVLPGTQAAYRLAVVTLTALVGLEEILIEIPMAELACCRATAAERAAAVEVPELWLVSVKSADSATAGRDIAVRVGPDTAILSLQNGVDNAARLAAAAGRPVIGAVVYVGTEMAGPGHVRHHGGGRLSIGASAASDMLARLLTEAGIPTTVTADIDAALWGKLIVNSAYNAMSAVAQIPYGAMIAVEGARDVMANVVAECVAVANASGVNLPADVLEKTLAVANNMPGQYSSTAQDLARGKRSEIDYLNGHVVRKGAELGIATPTNLALQVMVKLAERSRELKDGGKG